MASFEGGARGGGGGTNSLASAQLYIYLKAHRDKHKLCIEVRAFLRIETICAETHYNSLSIKELERMHMHFVTCGNITFSVAETPSEHFT